MKPIYLKVENFMNHSLSEIDCSQITSALVVAKNKHNDQESNGIGKTSLFSAIEYAVYGEIPTSVVDKIVRDGTDKCLVTFDFDVENERYRIERGRSKNGRSLLNVRQWNGSQWEKVSGTRIPEAEEKIAQIIKLNHKAFSYSIKFAQNDLTGLSTADKPEKRQKMLKEPLQLTDYTKLERVAMERAKPIKKDIERLDATIQMLGDPKAALHAAESELKYCQSTIQSRKNTIEKVSATLDEKRNTLESLKKSLDSGDAEIHDKISQLGRRSKELKGIIASSNERIQKNNSVIDETNKRCVALRKKLNEALEKEQELKSKNIRDKDEISKQLENVVNDELYGTRLLATYEAEYDATNKSLPSGNICPSCFQPIDSEHRKKCEDEVNKKLEEKSKLIQKTKTNLTKCRNKKQKLDQEYRDAVENHQSLQILQHEIKSSRSEIDLLNTNIKEAEQRLTDALKEMEKAQIEVDEVKINLDRLKNDADKSSAADINNQIFKANEEVRNYERSLENVRNELSEAQHRYGAAQERIKTAKNNLESLKEKKKQIIELRKKLKIHQYVINAFSPTGIPSFIVRTILDELQVEANNWLQKLRPELELEFNENADLFYRVNGAQREYKQLSGGQEVYIALSLKLGLSRVIQKKLGIDIRFLLLDEVDQSLDKSGVQAFSEVLRKLQEEFVIFVITHNNDLKDTFAHTILVEGDGKNGATSRLVNSW